MNIGIDIDGVLTDLERETIDFGTKMCIEENWPITIDLSKYWEVEAFGWTSEQADKFWNKYLVEYVTQSPARRFAKEIISKLREEGNNIYIITARFPSENFDIKAKTEEWLKKYGIKYDKLLLNVENKAQAAKDYNIEVFIDDSMKNCNQLSESGIKTYVFDTRINENIECDSKIKRVYSWLHLNQELESYMNK